MLVAGLAIAAVAGTLTKLWMDSIRENRRSDAAAAPQPTTLYKTQVQTRDDPGIRAVNAYAMRNKNQLLRRRRPREMVKF